MKEIDIRWQKLKSGDEKALGALYETYIDALYQYGIAFIYNEELVQDCIQDLFIHLWDKRENLNIPNDGKSYLIVSLRNRILNSIKKSKKTSLSNIDDNFMKDVEISIDEKIIAAEHTKEELAKLNKELSELSARQKEIIYLKFNKGLDYDQIAEILDINYQSARNLVHRTLMVLRKNMLILFLFYCLIYEYNKYSFWSYI